MKNYKDFEKEFIGSSDVATLIMVGCGEHGLTTQLLDFGEDGCYEAYYVNCENVEIGSHYAKVAEFKSWLKIYDDMELVKNFYADKIIVYRAGEFGCIVQTITD